MAANPAAIVAAIPSTASQAGRNLEQTICTKLLRTPLNQLAEAAGTDVSGASRIRAGERACSLSAWLRVMALIGFKLVAKDKLCVPAAELKMLRSAYSFISASDEMSERFASYLESASLDWEDRAE
jgi:hypothetical protein